MLTLDRKIYQDRLGDPSTWEGDWRRAGRYLNLEAHKQVQARMQTHHLMILGFAIRQHDASQIAAVLCVSREAVAERLRPQKLTMSRGRQGTPWPRAVA